MEDICKKADLERIVVLFDEAAHVLQPEHQRQFFTLFRDLRSPYISCNAAVYPGIMSFGDTFEQSHDATTVRVERDIRSDKYRNEMRSIVDVQAGSETMKHVERQGQNFDTLSYAASGNPRFLLKTLSQVPYLKTSDTTSTIRKYYRNDLWAEHSRLASRFPGLQTLIDWGAEFLKQDVLPRIHSKNEHSPSGTTRFFWYRMMRLLRFINPFNYLCILEL